MKLRADDRVLVLDIPPIPEVSAMARILSRGVLVALGDGASVDRARSALAEFENVMFIEADPRRIPWRERFFSLVLIPEHLAEVARAAQEEIARVLAADGRIESTSTDA